MVVALSGVVVISGSGNGEKWPEAAFILNFKLIGFLEGLDIKFVDNTIFDLPPRRAEL